MFGDPHRRSLAALAGFAVLVLLAACDTADDTSLDVPELVAPLDGETFGAKPTITFAWLVAPSAIGYEIEFQFNDEPEENTTITTPASQLTRTFDELGILRWRVRAVGDAEFGTWSALRTVLITGTTQSVAETYTISFSTSGLRVGDAFVASATVGLGASIASSLEQQGFAVEDVKSATTTSAELSLIAPAGTTLDRLDDVEIRFANGGLEETIADFGDTGAPVSTTAELTIVQGGSLDWIDLDDAFILAGTMSTGVHTFAVDLHVGSARGAGGINGSVTKPRRPVYPLTGDKNVTSDLLGKLHPRRHCRQHTTQHQPPTTIAATTTATTMARNATPARLAISLRSKTSVWSWWPTRQQSRSPA